MKKEGFQGAQKSNAMILKNEGTPMSKEFERKNSWEPKDETSYSSGL